MMIKKKLVLSACMILFASCCVATNVIAQPSAEEILKQVESRAAKIDEYRQLLNHPDQNVRVSALDVMLSSSDMVMREIGFSLGFASADDVMRGVTLRHKLADMTVLNFDITPNENASAEEIEQLKGWGDLYSINISKFDLRTGHFVIKGPNTNTEYGDGQVVGTNLNFNRDNGHWICKGRFALNDVSDLVGKISCSQRYSGNIAGFDSRLRVQ